MRIGILGGTGPAGSALGARLASVGYEVVLGSRTLERAQEKAAEVLGEWPDLTLALSGGDNAAAADCDLVVVATPWDGAVDTVAAVAPALAGKIVISMANALIRVNREFQPLIPPRGSVAAHIASVLPESRVVASFHHIPAKELGHLGEPVITDVLICSDDRAAATAVGEIVDKIPGCRPLQAGLLSNAMAIESFTAVLLQLNVRYKTRVAPRFTGLQDGA
jgi:8-hydroxy-5-deazaflavin:NADPH oxidoreductase